MLSEATYYLAKECSMAICEFDHRHLPKFNGLPDDQSMGARHKCCGCAYEQGLLDGHRGNPANPNPANWLESQAGDQRHKSANDAYQLGYNAGRNLR